VQETRPNDSWSKPESKLKNASTSLQLVQVHVCVCFTVPKVYSGSVQIVATKI